MRPLFRIFVIGDDEYYTPEMIRDLLRRAEDAGFSLDRGTELEQMTARQLDHLLQGRTDA